jgi:hypothetical protein
MVITHALTHTHTRGALFFNLITFLCGNNHYISKDLNIFDYILLVTTVDL